MRTIFRIFASVFVFDNLDKAVTAKARPQSPEPLPSSTTVLVLEPMSTSSSNCGDEMNLARCNPAGQAIDDVPSDPSFFSFSSLGDGTPGMEL